MKWSPGGESQDIEDRRDESGGGGFQFGGFHMGIGGALILLSLASFSEPICLPCLAAGLEVPVPP